MKYIKNFESYLSLNPGPVDDIYKRISLYEIADKIWAVVIPDDHLRCWVFLRCQEYYESSSPNFQNKRFTWSDYMNWYKSEGPRGKSDMFTYADDWTGFNLPSESIEDCISDIKDPGTYDHIMKSIVNTIRKKENGNFYLLGISDIQRNDVLDHEIAHGMWYTDPKYKSEMSTLLNSLNKKSLRLLFNQISELGYSDSVLDDEAQAYLSTGLYDEDGLNISKKDELKFQKVFNKYSKKHLLLSPKKYEIDYEN